MRKFVLFILLCFAYNLNAQNIGINSTGNTPDNSAGLDIEFTNKGLLIPRVALTSTSDNITITSPALSLIVYNSNSGISGIGAAGTGFYYWNGTLWVKLADATDNDTDPTNELQDLSVANDSLYISGGNVISLTDLTNIVMLSDTSGFILNGDTTYYPSGVVDTDNQNFTINGDTLFIEGGNYVLLGDLIISAQIDDSTFVINGDTIRLPQDLDTDPTNELQDLSVANDSLYISGGNVISLTDLTNITMLSDTSGFILNGDTTYYPSGVTDTDNQNFTINGDTLFIEGGNYVLLGDLIISAQLDDSTFVINGDTIRLPQDNDTNPTNELQDLSVANDSLYISGGNVISLTDLTNIIMLADTSGFILNGDTTYYPSGVTDTDNQNFTINGDTLFIEGGNYVLLGDLIISAQLDDSTFVINGDTIRLPQDLDTDPTNELQDLSVANDSLYISGGNVISLTDLTNIIMLADTSGFILNGDTTYYPSGVIDTDNQNFTINGDTLFIEGGNYVLLGDLIISAQIDDSTFVINGDTIRLPQDLDTDPTNELQDLSVANDSLYISGGNVISLTDLTNIVMLPDTSGFILNGDTTYYPSGVTDTDNQNFTINGDTLFIEGGNYVLLGDLIISAQIDDSTFVINGDTIRLPQDLDTDPTNELQDLSVANDSLYISGGNVISLTDLTTITMLADTSGFILNGDTTYYPSGVTDTDNQNFTINGDTLFIEGGNYVLLGDLVISAQIDDSTFVINGDTIRLPQDNDTDPTNELQDLSVANDSLYISGGNVISLTDLTNIVMLPDTSGFILNGDTTYYPSGVTDTDNQNFTINGDTLFIEGGNYVLLGDLVISAQIDDSTFVINGDTIRLPQDLDTDPTNELQDLSVANDSLYISGGNVISLTDLTNIVMLPDTSGFILNGDTTYYPSGVTDTDNQNFTINGDTLFIEGGNYVLLGDLVISAQIDDSTFVINGDTIRLPQDNDTDPTNELQDLSVANDSLYISGGNVISLTDLTNIVMLTDTSGFILNGDTTYYPSGVTDTDNQNFTINGDTLFIEGGNYVLLGDLVISAQLDDSTFVINGDTIRLSQDNDTDPTNELQDLSFANDTLYISGGNGLDINTIFQDNQQISISNDTIYLQDGGFAVLPAGLTDTDNQNFTINGDTLFIEGGNYVLLGDLVISAQLDDSTFVINGDTIRLSQDNDTDPTNELQDLSFANDTLYISGGNGLDINTIFQDNQQISISNDTIYLQDGGFAVLPAGLTDTDDQTFNINGDTLFIEGGNYVLLGDLVISAQLDDSTFVINGDTIRLSQDNDTDPTNELQDLSFANDTLYISGGNGLDINTIFQDNQQISISNDTIYLQDGGFAVLPAGLTDTDNQTFNINGDTLFIEGGNYILLGDLVITAQIDDSTFVINGDTIRLPQDNDTDPTNELQDLSFANDTLYISGGNGLDINTIFQDNQQISISNDTIYLQDGGFAVLPAGLTDTDDQTFNINGDTLFIEGGNYVLLGDLVISAQLDDSTFVINGDTIRLPQDNDTDPTNELQDLSFANDTLYISGGNGLDINTIFQDNQQISISNDTIYLQDGGFAVLPAGLTDTDDQTFNINGDTLFIEGGNYVLLGDLVISAQLDDSTFVINGDTIRLSQDNDTDPTNELQDLSFANDTLYISGGNGLDINTIFQDNQQISISNDTIYLEDGGFAILPEGLTDTDDQTFNINGDTLFIEGGNYVLLGDLVITAQLDDSTFVINGDTIRLPQDNDTDPTNELQDLSFANDTLYISGGNGLDINTIFQDNQQISISNDTIYLEDGGFAILPAGLTDTDDQYIDSLSLEGDSVIILSLVDDNRPAIRLNIASINNDWRINGNSNIVDGTHYIGTTNGVPLSFRVNNTIAGRIEDDAFAVGRRGNTSLGFNSLFSNSTGYGNASFGYQALLNNSSGGYNSAFGFNALRNNALGDYNIGIGGYSQFNNNSGTGNVGIGYAVLEQNISGNYNTAIGHRAGNSVLGSNNVFIGYESGALETGSNKLYIENSNVNADNALIYGEFDNNILRTNSRFQISNPAINGYEFPTTDGNTNDVLVTDGNGQLSWSNTNNNAWLIDGNTGTNASINFIGTTDMQPLIFKINNIHSGVLDSMFQNTSFGYKSLPNYTGINGNGNTAFGYKALSSNGITGQLNTAFGTSALRRNIDGLNNTAIGAGALSQSITISNNTAFGMNAMGLKTKGQYNTAVGRDAMYNNDSTFNTAIGTYALYYNYNGTGNTVIGHAAGLNNEGSHNVFLGTEAGGKDTLGSNKLYIENDDVDSNNALIYGEFDNNILRTNSRFQINNPALTGYEFPTNDGNASDVLVTDGNGQVNWVNSSTFGDHDWYDVSTGLPPNNISNDKYTIGNVSIGTSTPPSSDVSLFVLGEYIPNTPALLVNNGGGGNGIETNISGTINTGSNIYNSYHTSNINNSGIGVIIGQGFRMLGSGNSVSGTSNVINGSYTGLKMGTFNGFNGGLGSREEGVTNVFGGTFTNERRGLFNDFTAAEGSGPLYGLYNEFGTITEGSNIGMINRFFMPIAAPKYGVQNSYRTYNNDFNVAGVTNQFTADETTVNSDIRGTVNTFDGPHKSNTGTYTNFISNDNSTGTVFQYGARNLFTANNTNINQSGYSNLWNTNDNNGNGDRVGFYNEFNTSTGTGSQYGLYTRIFNTNTGINYGVRNDIDIDLGTNPNYGIYTNITGTNSGNKIGEYITIPNTAGGTHYGLLVDVPNTATGYAAHLTGEVQINGYTRLGEVANSAPLIKQMKLTAVSGADDAANRLVFVPHGLNDAKVLSVDILLDYVGGRIPPAYLDVPGYEYTFQVQAGTILLLNKPGNSANIYSKDVTILITYEE